MSPGQTVYAHVMEFGDDSPVTAYGLEIRFLVCGDGIVASPAIRGSVSPCALHARGRRW